MPAEAPAKHKGSKNASKVVSFRPPQEVLDVFWTLSDGTDEQRVAGAIKLSQLIEKSEEDVKKQILNYCKERLVRGLSSGRKFARVGFSVALTQLLRQYAELDTSDVLSTIKAKLILKGPERKTKKEVGGVYLGRAFAFSTLIKAGRLTQLSGEALSSLVEDLLKMSDKKSYLKAVCNRTIEDLIAQISSTSFEEHVWPKISSKLKWGWNSCTLDRLSLLMTCRDTFPKVTKKKFLMKHWGYPLLSEENDERLMRTILDTPQKSEILLEKILPKMLESERDVLSVWKGLGDKLTEQLQEKRTDVMLQRQLLALKIANKLLSSPGAEVEQILEIMLSPRLAKYIFHSIVKKNDPLAAAADSLCEQFCTKLKSSNYSVYDVLEKIWESEAAEVDKKKSNKINFNSNNFTRILDLLSQPEAEKYVEFLVSYVKGKEWPVVAIESGKQDKQLEYCVRQLQHIASSQLTNNTIQSTVLTFLLRLAFFQVNKTTKSIQHCEKCINFGAEDLHQQLCESAFYKCLDALSTLKTNQQSRWGQFSAYLDLMYHLAEYVQTLLTAESLKPIKEWPNEIKTEWKKLFALITKIKETAKNDKEASYNSAFMLLFLFLGFQFFTDHKMAVELLQDVYLCYEKASKGQKEKNDDEPPWVEVVTEVLLSLMSLNSHFGRVITATVFRSISSYLTPGAIALVSAVLIPKKSSADDAGGVLVEVDADDGDENPSDDEEADEPSEEESDEDKSDEEEGMDEDVDEEEEEEENVDENFRQSVKQALGEAAVDDDTSGDDIEDLPDLSDSDMFKLDDMLAEVFRLRKKGGGKKAREEKRKETANFRIKVLDLVEAIVKSERCGDFLIDLLKPLLLLMMENKPESIALVKRSTAVFKLLKSRAKGLKDTVHSVTDQKDFFKELLELAQTVTDATHLKLTSVACMIVMNLEFTGQHTGDSSAALSQCVDLLKETLVNVINKKQSKPSLSFFSSLIDLNPIRFKELSPMLVTSLQTETTKPHSKMICCSLLASLAKKSNNVNDSDKESLEKWMTKAATYVTQFILALDRAALQVMLTKDVLTLAVALQARTDIFTQSPFDVSVKKHLMDVKSAFNTDLRRLANKVISAIERSQSMSNKRKSKQKGNKRTNGDAPTEKSPAKKKRKL
ncbi:unnamed protein product [Lymnaea stagnalis]|uniref:DNA polymerase V n=1 Tax=Lymnaea stagnalis TaxID=6523 RepID=A0AAV2HV27_LYMST